MSAFNSPIWNGTPSPSSAGAVPIQPLLYMALRLAHVTKAPDATTFMPSPDQFADAILQANLMFDQAQVRRPLIYSVQFDTYILGTAKLYTLGPGGTLLDTNGNSVRPVNIERARLILNSTGKAVYLGIFKGTFREFSDLALQDIPGALPRFLYCDYAAPTANVYLIPQDQGGDQLELYTWVPMPSIANVQSLIVLPPGYQDWFVNNLAVRLASVFEERGASVTDDTRMQARLSTAAIMKLNMKSPRMGSDAPDSSRPRRGGDFNYFDGMPC